MELTKRTSSLRSTSIRTDAILSKEEAELQKFLLRAYCICSFACFCGIASCIYHLLSSSGDSSVTDEQRHYFFVQMVNAVYMFGVCLVTLGYTYKYGVSIYACVTSVMLLMFSMYVSWIFSASAEILHFINVLVVMLVAVGRTSHTRCREITNRVAYVSISMFVVCITAEMIDLEVDFGLHPLGRDVATTTVFLWITYVTPVVGNFFLVKLYVGAVLRQEQNAVKSVEVAYQIADKLANFDLDAAEKLIAKNTRLSGVDEDVVEPLSRLLNHLRSYNAFLPESLFSVAHAEAAESAPNKMLGNLMRGREPSWKHIETAVSRLLDEKYTLHCFHADMVAAYPELELYKQAEEKMTSGRSKTEEYQRTLSALYSFYCLLRIEIDGKECFCYGVGEDGHALKAPIGSDAQKKAVFYDEVPWDALTDLMLRAELIKFDETGQREFALCAERVISMLALTAIHDIMKNKALLPRLDPRHAPFRGYAAMEEIGDHDTALEYILEHFPALLPSYKILGPRQRAPILFSQSKMGFNNGWLVQAEAPPGALFTRFKKVIKEGRASKCDISFYFVHWFTDLAGAEPFNDRPWPGAEKFTVKFPVKVLSAFLESFSFVDQLAAETEVETMERYLVSRYTRLGSSAAILPSHSEIALMRLTLMAQDFESHVAKAYAQVSQANRVLLSEELARTGCREQFRRAPSQLHLGPAGPAILIYYAPALMQHAGATQCCDALRVLAAIFRTARLLFPLSPGRAEETVTVRIDALKVLTPKEILSMSPWHLRKTSSIDGEVASGQPPEDSGAYAVVLQIDLPVFSL